MTVSDVLKKIGGFFKAFAVKFAALFKKKQKTEEDYYLASQWTLMGRKLVKHKLAKVSMWILGIVSLTRRRYCMKTGFPWKSSAAGCATS